MTCPGCGARERLADGRCAYCRGQLGAGGRRPPYPWWSSLPDGVASVPEGGYDARPAGFLETLTIAGPPYGLGYTPPGHTLFYDRRVLKKMVLREHSPLGS